MAAFNVDLMIVSVQLRKKKLRTDGKGVEASLYDRSFPRIRNYATTEGVLLSLRSQAMALCIQKIIKFPTTAKCQEKIV